MGCDSNEVYVETARAAAETASKLNSTTDAHIWASEFIRLCKLHSWVIDYSLVLGWFANAIETGRSAGYHARYKEEGDKVTTADTLQPHWSVRIEYEPGNLCEPTGWKYRAIPDYDDTGTVGLYADAFKTSLDAETHARLAIKAYRTPRDVPSYTVDMYG